MSRTYVQNTDSGGIRTVPDLDDWVAGCKDFVLLLVELCLSEILAVHFSQDMMNSHSDGDV